MASYKDTETQTSLSGECHCLHHPGTVHPTPPSDEIEARFDDATQKMTALIGNMLTSHRDKSEELFKSYFGSLLRDLPTYFVEKNANPIIPLPKAVAHQQPVPNQPTALNRNPREVRVDWSRYDYKASLNDAIKAAEMSTSKPVTSIRDMHTNKEDQSPKGFNAAERTYDDEDYSGIQSLRDRMGKDSGGGTSSFIKQRGQVVSTGWSKKKSDQTLLP